MRASRRALIRNHLREGGVIAYPTEGVFGLGCDPFNPKAVERIFDLKGRSRQKGFILIAASREQLRRLVPQLPSEVEEKLRKPQPITWIVPARPWVPKWLCGRHRTLAVRITAHPLAAELCRVFGGPLISTSANRSGRPPAKRLWEVYRNFGKVQDLLIVPGNVGNLQGPTPIFEARTGRRLR